MNLWDFLKYSDKYNNFRIYTKNKEITFSHNGNYGAIEDDKLFDLDLVDWKVLSYKVDFDDDEIQVFIAPDNQLMQSYNHFPDTKEKRLNYK